MRAFLIDTSQVCPLLLPKRKLSPKAWLTGQLKRQKSYLEMILRHKQIIKKEKIQYELQNMDNPRFRNLRG